MYAKIFEEIFDSSIADNYELRHFFMDLLVLSDCNGVVDRTASAIASRTRIPLDKVQAMLDQLECPDPQSKNPAHEGRRIERFDKHRSWGWYIVNFGHYRDIFREKDRRAASKARVERHRTSVASESTDLLANQACNAIKKNVTLPAIDIGVSVSAKGGAGGKFKKPSLELVKQHGIKMDLPEVECEKFFNYYEANGWRVGKNSMKLWTAAMANWKRHWIEYSSGSKEFSPPDVETVKAFVETESVDKQAARDWFLKCREKGWNGIVDWKASLLRHLDFWKQRNQEGGRV